MHTPRGSTTSRCLAVEMGPWKVGIAALQRQTPHTSGLAAPLWDATTTLCMGSSARLCWKPGCRLCVAARWEHQPLLTQIPQGNSGLMPLRHCVTSPMFQGISWFALLQNAHCTNFSLRKEVTACHFKFT